MEVAKNKKYTNQEYKFICELLWGGVPTDRNWAEETGMFKEEAPKILAKYPMLDKSFFDVALQKNKD